MKISEVTIYKLEASNEELDISIIYSSAEIEGPYYRINNKWYRSLNNSTIYPINGETGYHEKGAFSKILEKNFQDMMPFKGQLELF